MAWVHWGSPLSPCRLEGQISFLSKHGGQCTLFLLESAFLQNIRVQSSVQVFKEAQDSSCVSPSLPSSSSLLFLSFYQCCSETETQGKQEGSWHTPLLWWGPQRWHWCLLWAESTGGTQPWVPGSRHGGPGGRALVCLALWQPFWDQEAQLRWAPLLAPAPGCVPRAEERERPCGSRHQNICFNRCLHPLRPLDPAGLK